MLDVSGLDVSAERRRYRPAVVSGSRDIATSAARRGRRGMTRGNDDEACAGFDEFQPPAGPLAAADKQLVSTIEREIIPRMLLAHRPRHAAGEAGPAEPSSLTPDAEDIRELTRLTLQHDEAVAYAYVQGLRAKGISFESLLLDLLAPAARRLDRLWETDSADFVSVTVALGRLQHLMHVLRREYSDEREAAQLDPRRRALMASYSGDQHIFGALMVSELLRRANWTVTFEPAMSVADMLAALHGQWFAVVGLSLSCDRDPAGIQADIKAIRRASKNKNIGVIVGGRVFLDNPELIDSSGADAAPTDAKAATAEAEDLFTHTLSC